MPEVTCTGPSSGTLKPMDDSADDPTIYSKADIAKVYRRYCTLCGDKTKSPAVARERNATLALLRRVTNSPADDLALTRGRAAAGVKRRWAKGIGLAVRKRSERIGLPKRITSVVTNNVGRGKRQ